MKVKEIFENYSSSKLWKLKGTMKISRLTIHRFLLLFSHQVMSGSLQGYELQWTRPPCPSLSLGACSNSCPLSQWCHPTISSSVAPFFPALNLSQHQCLFQWVDSLHQVAKVMEFQHHSRFILIIQKKKKKNRKRDGRRDGEKKEGREEEKKTSLMW